MNIAKFLKQASIAFALLLGAQTSQAVIVTKTFSAEVFFGPYAGAVGTGSFSYEDSFLSGFDYDSADMGSSEFFALGPAGSTLVDGPGGLTAFEFTLLGQTFSMADDEAFPDLPVVDFIDLDPLLGATDIVPDFIDFAVVDLAPVDILEPGVVALGAFGPLFAGAPGGPDFEAEAFVDVPEPASLALFGIGLLGMGWRRSRV